MKLSIPTSKVTLLALTLIGSTGHLCAQQDHMLDSTHLHKTIDILDEQIPLKIEVNNVPGAVVSIIYADSCIYNKGFGVRDYELGLPVDPDNTVFRVASLSKIVTTIAALQLVEKGALDLDEDVDSYLGDIEIINPFEEQVTLRHLLTHSSGLDHKNMARRSLSVSEVPDLIEYLKSELPPVVRKPGEVISYSNYGMALVGYLVEKASGKSYATYVQEQIFNPLSMNNSSFTDPDGFGDNLSKGYLNNFKTAPFEYYKTPPASMLMTTGRDMSRLMTMMLNHGVYNGKQVLGKSFVAQMLETNFRNHPRANGRSLGLSVFDTSPKLVFHNGNFRGFYSSIYLYPDLDLGFFFSFNNNLAYIINREVMAKVNEGILELKSTDGSNVISTTSMMPEDIREGRYKHVRNAYSTLEKIQNFPASGIRVKKLKDSQIQVNRDSYTYIGDHTFISDDKSQIFFKKNSEYLIMGEDAYQRLGWYENSIIQALSFLLLMGISMLILIIQLIRKFRNKSKIQNSSIRKFGKLSISISGIVVFFVVSFILILNFLSVSYNIPAILKIILIFPHLSALLSLSLPFFLYKVIRDTELSKFKKVLASAYTVFMLYHIYFAFHWNILFYKF